MSVPHCFRSLLRLISDEAIYRTLLTSSQLRDYQMVKTRSKEQQQGRSNGATSPSSRSNSAITHLVTVSPYRRTLTLMRALLLGAQIVTIQWLVECTNLGCWVVEDAYRVSQ